MVSYNKTQPGYVRWSSLSVENDFRVLLKFKTNEKDGLIFYVTDFNQDNGVSLSLVDGHLKVISQKTELVSKDTFDDSEWHVVSVIHNDKIFRMDYDDYASKVYVLIILFGSKCVLTKKIFNRTDSNPPPLHILHGNIFVGGLPPKFKLEPDTVGSSKQFHGCIADFTLNGEVKNFANTTDRSNGILDKCILDPDYLPIDPSVHQCKLTEC